MSSGSVRHADKKANSGAYAGYTPVSSARVCTSTFSGEGGTWGDGGPLDAIRFDDGTTLAVDDIPDRLWQADVGYYPSTHRATVAVALDFLAGKSTQPYFAADAADDIEATEAVIRSAQAK